PLPSLLDPASRVFGSSYGVLLWLRKSAASKGFSSPTFSSPRSATWSPSMGRQTECSESFRSTPSGIDPDSQHPLLLLRKNRRRAYRGAPLREEYRLGRSARSR